MEQWTYEFENSAITIEVLSAPIGIGSASMPNKKMYSGLLYDKHNVLHSVPNNPSALEIFLQLVDYAREVYGHTNKIILRTYDTDD